MAGTFHAKEQLELGNPIVVAKIVKTMGSTPRHEGSWMYMAVDGSIGGTIGGGKLEAEVMKICKQTFETKQDQIFHFRLVEKDKDPNALDMGCGGDADVSIEYIDPEHKDRLEVHTAKKPVYIFGAGHISQALDPVLRHVNFETVIVDDREEFANRERFPGADEIKLIDDFATDVAKLPIDENSFVIIVTRGHNNDYDVLKNVILTDAAYVGMIGSKAKNAILYKRLRENGYSEEEIESVYAPIGISIHAETPEEIAVSITAEMISVRAGYGKNS